MCTELQNNVIAVYHHPQECGSPYLAFISQKSGEIVDSVTIPDGYQYSGLEVVTYLQRVKSFKAHISQSPKPTLDNVDVRYNRVKYSGRHKPHYVLRPTKVTITGEDDFLIHTYEADVDVDVLLEKKGYKFDANQDSFRKQMEESGFDMKGWCLYKRRKTDFIHFLKSILTNYKNYNVINLVTIG